MQTRDTALPKLYQLNVTEKQLLAVSLLMVLGKQAVHADIVGMLNTCRMIDSLPNAMREAAKVADDIRRLLETAREEKAT